MWLSEVYGNGAEYRKGKHTKEMWNEKYQLLDARNQLNFCNSSDFCVFVLIVLVKFFFFVGWDQFYVHNLPGKFFNFKITKVCTVWNNLGSVACL